MAASYENHPKVTRFLIVSGADLNHQTKVVFYVMFHSMFTIPHTCILSQKGWSPLQIACDRGNIDIVKLLILSNANIELKNKVVLS